MLETLDAWDKTLFLQLNALHTPWLDPVMDWISNSHFPVFLILVLMTYYGVKAFGKKAGWLVLLALLNFGATDAVSSKIFKPTFERLRPCHNPEFEGKYHTVGRCWGGKFGFVSSHASNSFGVAFFLWLVFRRRYRWFALLIPYAALVSYTRIYLAKHYLFDLVGGAALGAVCAMVFFIVWKSLVLRKRPDPSPL